MSFSTQDPTPETNKSSNVDSLVLQAKNGDVGAFEELYRLYYNRICLYLTHTVGDDGIGCELTQETFLKVWRAMPNLRETTKFTSWLYRVATNLAYDHQRQIRRKNERYYHQISSLEKVTTPGPEELVETKELTRIALSRIPLKHRICLILYHIEGLSKQEIAEYVGMKESSIGTYVSAGLEQFRQIYKNLSQSSFVARSRSQQ